MVLILSSPSFSEKDLDSLRYKINKVVTDHEIHGYEKC